MLGLCCIKATKKSLLLGGIVLEFNFIERSFMNEGLNVLSLFDGMSSGMIALERAGIKVKNYYASEIDKYAIKVSKANYPNIIQLGDVTSVDVSTLPKIDLLIGGSPCQGFSMAGKQIAFDDPRSKLYFEYERILKELQVINPNIKFLLENVKMKQEFKDVITSRLGVEPIAINSNLVSAQNRYRLYWTNIRWAGHPEDKGIYLKDIIENDVDEKFFIRYGRLKWLKEFGKVKEKDGYIAFNPSKAKCLTVRSEPSWNTTYLVQPVREVGRRLDADGVRCDNDKSIPITRQYEVGMSEKSNCITTVQKDSFVIQWSTTNLLLNEGLVRKLTPTECERLQTVPDGYTSCVSDSQRYKMLGNGWTVDVIAHIFQGLK